MAGHEVYAIDKVYRLKKEPDGEVEQAFKPFYSLQHAEGRGESRYWYVQRGFNATDLAPGHETQIGLVDIDFDASAQETDPISIEVRATNRDLPSLLSVGASGGDMDLGNNDHKFKVRLLHKPPPSRRVETAKGALWRVISHLSPNHLSLSAGRLDALKEMLRLYDRKRSFDCVLADRGADGLSASQCWSMSAMRQGSRAS